GERETVADETARFDLEPFERAIDVAHRGAAAGFFAKDVPRFERGAKLDLHVALREIADAREAELKVRGEPVEVEGIAAIAQIVDHIFEVRLAEVRQHPAVMDVRAPADEAVVVRLT